MKWVTYCDEDCLAMQDDDLLLAKPLIERAREIWVKNYKDIGPVTYSSGITVLFLPKKCRKPKKHIIIPSPGQGNGADSVNSAMDFLHRYGIPCFFEEGVLD